LYSLERAGIAAIVLLTLAFCLCLRKYKMLMNVIFLAVAMAAVVGLVNPDALGNRAAALRDAVFYKGHKEEGLLSSRLSPWDETLQSIKQHPWFGTGYGTSPTGEDDFTGFERYSSTANTSREHGSSYMTIVEWLGFLGVLPFVALVIFSVFHVCRVGIWLRRSDRASHYSVPFAMVLFAGFIHAGFEDWMFAVGYYLCVYFWALSFVLTDLLPTKSEVSSAGLVLGSSRQTAFHVGAIVPSR
jgi:O-antigen ligase